jgi:hypothetical protein
MDAPGGGSQHTTAHPVAVLPSNVETFSAGARPANHDSKGEQAQTGRHVLSATRVVALLVLGLAAVAVLVPLPLHRPAWIETEVVLLVWWALWAVVLSWMLYLGIGLHDDLAVPTGTNADEGDHWWHHLGGLDLGHFGPGDWLGFEEGGAALAIVVLLLLGVFILIGVVLMEVVLPLLVPLGYAVLFWMLRRVLHHHPVCRRSIARSIGTGVWWASVYSAPLALAVVVVHALF